MQDKSDGRAGEPASKASRETKTRGFAAMEPDRLKRVASMGGQAAHRRGVAHEFTKEEASAAGKLGGKKVASIPGHMSAMGRRGAKARGEGLPAGEG